MNEDILKKIISAFAEEADLEAANLSAGSTLMDDLGLTSMEIMSALAVLEREFSVRIPEKALRYFVSIGDIARYISDRI